MRYFPLFLDVFHKPVLVVGGGEVASRKVDALIRAQAKVTVIAPDITPFLQAQVQQGACMWRNETYHKQCLTPDWIQVWATTDDNQLNHQIYDDAHQQHLLVNVVDDLPYCDFITPSMINRGRVQVAISSGGASPVLIRNIRESIEAVLPQNTELLAQFAGNKREDIKGVFPSVEQRRRFWERFFADYRVKDAADVTALESVYQYYCQMTMKPVRQVLWVLADDVELLPIKALREMQQAECVLYGGQACEAYLEFCRRDAERAVYDTDSQCVTQLCALRQRVSQLVVIIAHSSLHLWQQYGQGERLMVSGKEQRS